jgi:TPR repeat protein
LYDGKDADVLKYLTKASALGWEKATIEMAIRLCTGNGVTEQLKQEFGEWERKHGDSFAGMMLDVFVEKDTREEELKKRGQSILEQYAEKGNGQAQYYLGILYTDNRYLGKNKELARKWLKKAKDNNIPAADYAYSVVSKSFWGLGPGLDYFVV